MLLEVRSHTGVIKPLSCFQGWGLTDFSTKRVWERTTMLFWSSSIKAGRDVEWGCGTTSVSLFRWRLGLFLLRVMLCWMGHRNQPDIPHHAFNFRRESMIQLLSGHGIRIPGYLEKNYKLWELWQGGWKHQPCPYQFSVQTVGSIAWICKAKALKFNQYRRVISVSSFLKSVNVTLICPNVHILFMVCCL